MGRDDLMYPAHDIRMPEMSGKDLVRSLQEEFFI
jgi:YesN/AraC family two-component response regulator